MRIELQLDRAGFWWSGLGFSAHIAKEPRVDGERTVSWRRQGDGSRVFRLGSLEGVVSRAA